MKNSPDTQSEWRIAESREALGRMLAEDVAKALEGRSAPLLAVSGGSTPVPFFEALNPLLPENTTVTLTDERWVPPDDAESNERLMRQYLPKASPLPLKVDGSLKEAIPKVERRFSALPAFDAVVIGMGEDGHTASLFPHHPALKEGLAANGPACLAITDSPKPPSERITLTFQRLMNTRRLILHITGTAKRDVLERVMQPGPVEDYPIRAFLRQTDIPTVIYWAP